MPATGALIGTPASINARVEPQTDAIEVEPLEDKTSDTSRRDIGYGELVERLIAEALGEDHAPAEAEGVAAR